MLPHPVIALVAAVAAAQEGVDPYAWDTPPPEVQLEQDHTPIPLGKGAIFIPSMSGALNESPGMILEGDSLLDVPIGQRFLIDPGSYVVIITSGTPGQGVGVPVEVKEAETAIVPVKWGALRIEVTDDHRVPHRGSYELIRSETREPYGTGFGADTLQGETLHTWLLPPGVYRVVRQGGTYRALRDFATVEVPESGFVRFRLVTDPTTGEFYGAGVLLPGEFGSPPAQHRGNWFKSLVIGGDGSLVDTSNVVGEFNQTTLAGDVFGDFQLGYKRDAHQVSLLAQVDEGVSQIRPQNSAPLPLVKSTDQLRADLLYTWYVVSWIGPYARAEAESQAFATTLVAVEDTNLALEDPDGNLVRTQFVPANGTFRLADAWEPTIAREGAGVNALIFDDRFATLNWRVGLGLRQNHYAGAYVPEDNPVTDDVEYKEVESFVEEGIESTVVATFRLPGWVVYATDVELFEDFFAPTQPSVEWRNTLSFRLTRNLSLNYFANVDYLPLVVTAPQVEQSLLLRFSWAPL